MRTLLAVLLVLTFAPALADYLAYSISDKGRSPLPERIDDIDAEHLLNLEWGDFDGKRVRVGVLEVDNNSSTASFTVKDSSGVAYEAEWSHSGSGMVPVNGIEAIVTDTMNRTGRFRLVERAAIGDVIGEQDLASSGRVAQPSGAATGQILGAEILVQVVVTDYEEKTSGTSKGVGGLFRKVPVIGGVGVSSDEGRVGLNIRLIDPTTN